MSRRIPLFLFVALACAAPVASVRAGDPAEVRVESFRLLNEGVAAYQRGDYKEAVDKLRRSASIALNSFKAHYYLGLALMGDRRYDEALDALEIALDLDPNFIQAHVAMGDAQLLRGDLDEANASYYRALKLRAEYSPALDGLARLAEAKAEDDKAVEFFRRAIASNKGYAEAYTHLGDLYLRQDRLDEAVDLLVEAITIRPDFAPGLNRLAAAYGRLGLRNEAVATIQRAIELQPRAPEHHATLGWIQLAMNLPDAAAESFREALALDPGLPRALEGMGEAARRRGEYDAAIAYLETGLQDPRTDTATRERFRARQEALAEEREHVATLEAARESGEASATDLRDLATAYAGRALWSRAAEIQEASEPTGVERERLAFYRTMAGEYRDAERIYGELAGAEEDRPDLVANLGVALAGLGDDRAAAEAFRRALESDPALLPARLYLANALLRLGRREEAIAAYRRFLSEGGSGEAAERVRRVLSVLEPEAAPAKEPPPAAAEPEKEAAS